MNRICDSFGSIRAISRFFQYLFIEKKKRLKREPKLYDYRERGKIRKESLFDVIHVCCE